MIHMKESKQQMFPCNGQLHYLDLSPFMCGHINKGFIAPSQNVKCLRRWFILNLMADCDIVLLNVISCVSFFIVCFQYAPVEGSFYMWFPLVSASVQHLTVFQWLMEPSAGPGLNPRHSRGTFVFAIQTFVLSVHQVLLGQLQYYDICSGKVSNTKSAFKEMIISVK